MVRIEEVPQEAVQVAAAPRHVHNHRRHRHHHHNVVSSADEDDGGEFEDDIFPEIILERDQPQNSNNNHSNNRHSTTDDEEEDDRTYNEFDPSDPKHTDHLLYDEDLDDEDEAYVYKHLRGGVKETVTILQQQQQQQQLHKENNKLKYINHVILTPYSLVHVALI